MVTKSIFHLASLLAILGISACKILDLKIIVTKSNDPKTYTFDVQGDDGFPITNWLWDLGDTTLVKGKKKVIHTYGSQGEYVVRVSGGHGRNAGADTVHVKVCTENFDVGATINGCSTITLTLPAGSTAETIDWGDGSAFDGSLTRNYAVGGQKSLTVVLNTNTPCGQVTWQDTITLGDNPAAGFKLGHVGLLLDVKNITKGSTAGYKWDFGDHSPISQVVQGRHQYSDSGNYTITLTAEPTECTRGDIIVQSITIPAPKEYYLTEFKDECECEATETISAPGYFDNENLKRIEADDLSLYGTDKTVIMEDMDTLNGGTPQIRWEENSTLYVRQVVIITSQRPIDSDGNFVGAAVGDWMWTIEMDEVKDGIVNFSQGKTIERITNGSPIYKEGPPEPLKPGVYFWMVYAFNDNATSIGACSRVHLFYVP